MCGKFNGLTLDQSSQPLLNLSYAVPNTNDEGWLRAAWQINDPTYTTSRKTNIDECNTILSTVLNGCDTDSIDFKYGGFKVNECNVWTIALDGSPRVSSDLVLKIHNSAYATMGTSTISTLTENATR
jgi:hypothetical protein